MAKVENLDGVFWSYTYSLFKENHSVESKLIEYAIILLHKYKVEQTQVISRLLFIFSSQILSQYHEFRKYTSSHTLKVSKAPNQSVVKNINMFF